MGRLGVTWGHLGLSRGHLVPSWVHFGAILGPSWAVLGPSGAILGRLGTIWGHLELSWGHLVAMLSRVAAKTASRGPHVAQNLFFCNEFQLFYDAIMSRLGPSWSHLGAIQMLPLT